MKTCQDCSFWDIANKKCYVWEISPVPPDKPKPSGPLSCSYFTAKPRPRPEKISSHCGWYRGLWEKDVCHCGEAILVPRGSKGKYQCNSCADRAEGLHG